MSTLLIPFNDQQLTNQKINSESKKNINYINISNVVTNSRAHNNRTRKRKKEIQTINFIIDIMYSQIVNNQENELFNTSMLFNVKQYKETWWMNMANVDEKQFDEYKDSVAKQLQAIQNTLTRIEANSATKADVGSSAKSVKLWITGAAVTLLLAFIAWTYYCVIPKLVEIIVLK